MKTFTVLAAQYNGYHEIQAEKIGSVTEYGVQLLDTDGKVVAIVSLANVAAVYQNAPSK